MVRSTALSWMCGINAEFDWHEQQSALLLDVVLGDRKSIEQYEAGAWLCAKP